MLDTKFILKFLHKSYKNHKRLIKSQIPANTVSYRINLGRQRGHTEAISRFYNWLEDKGKISVIVTPSVETAEEYRHRYNIEAMSIDRFLKVYRGEEIFEWDAIILDNASYIFDDRLLLSFEGRLQKRSRGTPVMYVG